jgi:parallel beta-helix repeat protein
MLVLAFNVGLVRAQSETVYINADGSITPAGAPVVTSDNITYTFNDSMSYPTYYGIVVNRSDIIINGRGYAVQGNQSGNGLCLMSVSNVTIQDINVEGFENGMYLFSSSSNSIMTNNMTNNGDGIIVDSSSSNSVSLNNITANTYEGIELDSSSINSVSGNNIAKNGNNIENYIGGVYLYSSSNNSVSVNNITSNVNEGIYLYSSSNNSLSLNNIMNNYYGIEFYFSSSYNSVSGNNITANMNYGIYLGYSSSNSFYHNNFINNITPQVSSVQSTNVWDDGYPAGGNYWSDYQTRYPNASETDNSGIWNTSYYIDANNTDNYPLMGLCTGVHDVGTTALDLLNRNVTCRGYNMTVTVTVTDLGDFTETLNVTVYANATYIASQNVTLSSRNSTSITFTCNSIGLAYGNYTLSVYAWPVPGETNMANNNCTGGWVIVAGVGDITGSPSGLPDGVCDISDVAYVASLFGMTSSKRGWQPNADVNNDGVIDISDVAIVAASFGKVYPYPPYP